ncbi:MAG: hypothetical protein Q8M03_08760 [Legionella sp.]|nr:hypothetical protein [Legionella sp.]
MSTQEIVMYFPLTESTNPRYLYVNPETNMVHVLMPIVGGGSIGLDNTCKSVYALQEFFGKSRAVNQRAVLDELTAYKKTLEFDISLVNENFELVAKKQERLRQIDPYITAIEAIINSPVLDTLNQVYPAYPEALKALMTRDDSNLYSMVLRPQEMDDNLRLVNPVFSVKRDGVSIFYDALVGACQEMTVFPDAKERFCDNVRASLEGQPTDFEDIRDALKEYFIGLADVDEVDFYRTNTNEPVTKEFIEEILGCDEEQPATAKDYVEALLKTCIPELLENLVESPFYMAKTAEDLSIITQFFLGIINFHCSSHEISAVNFGAVLDNSEELSGTIAVKLLSSLKKGSSIEDVLLQFVEDNSESFGLKIPLFPIHRAKIKERFWQNYSEIMKSDHFDEFALMGDSKPTLFVNHQGSICCNLGEFIQVALPEINQDYFKHICDDFSSLNGAITSTNPAVLAIVEINLDVLLSKIINEEQLEAVLKKLPAEQKVNILASPQVRQMQLPKLLRHVARGEQDEAKSLLDASDDALLLQQTREFADYSDRLFNCTAYEYAYWAKDTHMCRMLEQKMDEETKAEMLERCEVMERDGLTYIQHGEEKNSKHFDLTPLVTALQNYADALRNRADWSVMQDALRNVELARRDIPAHVAHEYCRLNCSFNPLPDFKEDFLPRVLTFYNWETERQEFWWGVMGITGWPGSDDALREITALKRLDEVRTDDLVQSKETLGQLIENSLQIY